MVCMFTLTCCHFYENTKHSNYITLNNTASYAFLRNMNYRKKMGMECWFGEGS